MSEISMYAYEDYSAFEPRLLEGPNPEDEKTVSIDWSSIAL